jgi:hypothetical protein
MKVNISLFTYRDAFKLFSMAVYTLVLYYVLFFLATGLHEMLHMITGSLLGYEGSISYSMGYNIIMGFYYYQSMGNELHNTLILLSGGLGTSLLFSVFFLLVRKYNNSYFKFVIIGVIFWQFLYCLLESRIIPSDFDSSMKSSMAICVGSAISLLINLKGFIKMVLF